MKKVFLFYGGGANFKRFKNVINAIFKGVDWNAYLKSNKCRWTNIEFLFMETDDRNDVINNARQLTYNYERVIIVPFNVVFQKSAAEVLLRFTQPDILAEEIDYQFTHQFNNGLIICRGAPGSGKTTTAKSWLEDGIIDSFHEQDHYFMEGDIYKYDHSKIQEAVAQCKERVIRDLRAGLFVAVCNNFTRAWQVEQYVSIAKRIGTEHQVFKFATRYKNTMGVPEDVVQREIDNYEPFEGEVVLD